MRGESVSVQALKLDGRVRLNRAFWETCGDCKFSVLSVYLLMLF